VQLRSGVVETLPVFAATPWQMSFGERATLEGVLSQLQPSLALEIGTAEGGSLRRVAAHAGEVHSFDLVPPPPDLAGLESVTFHSGDSHELLPRVLADLAAAGRNVDFVLVDGDHSAAGVKRDLLDLLASDAIRQTIVLLHDTMNDEVRAGIEAARAHEHPKVAYLDLDFVPGYLARHEPYRLELWGGLGLIAVDEARTFNAVGPVRQDGLHELFSIVRPTVGAMRELDRAGERFDDQPAQRVQARLHAAWARRPAAPQAQPPGYGAGYPDAAARQSAAELDLERANRILRDMQASLSWRLTAPLRLLKRTLGRLTRA
jgi:Methyltransferase domain